MVKNNVTLRESIKATVESIKYSSPYTDYFSNRIRLLKDKIEDTKLQILSTTKSIKSNQELLVNQWIELKAYKRIKLVLEEVISDERKKLKMQDTTPPNEDQKPNHAYISEDYKK